MITSGRRTSAPDDLRPTAHRRSSVAELLRLHGLALAAVRNRVEQEVGADGIHVHQVIAAVGGDAAVPVEASQLALLDLVDAPGRDAEVLAALRDRRDAVARDVVPVVDLPDDGARVAITAGEDGVRHPDERDHRGLGRSEEHTSELQSQSNLVCRLLLEKKKKTRTNRNQESCEKE